MPHEKGKMIYTAVTAPGHLSVRSMASVLCCGAVCEPAGWQQPTGSRLPPLGPWASKYTPGFAPELLQPSYVVHMQYSTDSLLLCFCCLMIWSFQALRRSDSWGTAHITLSHNSLTKQMRRQFIFTIINFFFIVVKTLQESNTGWHTMPTATRQTSRSKKRDTNNCLLAFCISAVGLTPHSRLSMMFQDLWNHNSFLFIALGFQEIHLLKKRCQSSYEEITS